MDGVKIICHNSADDQNVVVLLDLHGDRLVKDATVMNVIVQKVTPK